MYKTSVRPILSITLLFVLFSVVCCHSRILNTSLTYEHFTFRGTLYIGTGRAPYCYLECLSDSGLIKFVQPQLLSGEYEFELSAAEANNFSRFRVTSQGLDTIIADFDQRLLKDSVIITDFVMKETSKPYRVRVHMSSNSRTTYDTIWLDLKGNRVTKAVSDSLWRKER